MKDEFDLFGGRPEKSLWDFERPPVDHPLPSARRFITQMLEERNYNAVMELTEKETNCFFPPETHNRVRSLVYDGLINDRELEQVFLRKDSDTFERMIKRLEEQERENLRKSRREVLKFEDLEREFPQQIAELSPNIAEELEKLVNLGSVEPKEIKNLLRNNQIEELTDEVIERGHVHAYEHSHTQGRTR